jgi:hypothetical protein
MRKNPLRFAGGSKHTGAPGAPEKSQRNEQFLRWQQAHCRAGRLARPYSLSSSTSKASFDEDFSKYFRAQAGTKSGFCKSLFR